jgi:hypothetical protein
VALPQAQPKRRRCTRYLNVRGTIALDARAGLNRVRFQGRISQSRALKPGKYRLTAIATDGAGNSSKHKRASFMLRPKKNRRQWPAVLLPDRTSRCPR